MIAALLGGWAWPAAADERVVLLEDEGRPNPGLTSALRIQLTGVAELDVRQAPGASGVSLRVQAASRLAEEDGVLVVTWAEPPVELEDGSHEAVLYVVGHKQGRALLEVVRVPGGSGPDVDRTLALKLREVVDEVRQNRARATAAADVMLEPAAPEPAEPSDSQWDASVAVEGAVAPLAGSDLGQWGARMRGGPAWRSGGLRLSALLQLTVFPQVDIARGDSHVRFYEIAPGLLLRAQLRQGPLWLGVRAGPELSWASAHGENDRAAGEQTELVPSIAVGADVELPLGDGASLAAALELQARLKRQRFTVDRERVADLGRARPVASIALVWHGPAVR